MNHGSCRNLYRIVIEDEFIQIRVGQFAFYRLG